MSKRALLIGINRFQGQKKVEAAQRIRNLHGCENDARHIRRALVDYFGFADSENEIQVLLSARATKKAIREKLEWVVDRDGYDGDDVRLVYLSTHGTRVPGAENEYDGYEEAFVPYDFDKKGGFIDNELAEILKKAPENLPLTLIADCCFSGTLQDSASEVPAPVPVPEVIEAEPPPELVVFEDQAVDQVELLSIDIRSNGAVAQVRSKDSGKRFELRRGDRLSDAEVWGIWSHEIVFERKGRDEAGMDLDSHVGIAPEREVTIELEGERAAAVREELEPELYDNLEPSAASRYGSEDAVAAEPEPAEPAPFEVIGVRRFGSSSPRFDGKGDFFDVTRGDGRVVGIAACRDDQESVEIRLANGQPQGGLTWALLETIEKTKGDVTYEQLIDAAGGKLDTVWKQTPQLEARKEWQQLKVLRPLSAPPQTSTSQQIGDDMTQEGHTCLQCGQEIPEDKPEFLRSKIIAYLAAATLAKSAKAKEKLMAEAGLPRELQRAIENGEIQKILNVLTPIFKPVGSGGSGGGN